MDNPLITIYVPCHNYGQFLIQAVESVFAQLYTNWELFIINDGSSDDSAEVARELVERSPGKVALITNESPQGLQKSANEILSIAKGQYIMRLDADDWLDESALLIMISKVLQDPDIGLVYGSYYYVDPDGAVIGIEKQYKLWDEDKSGLNPPHGACTLVNTRSLKAVGGYSEDINAQDGWELWFKLINRTKIASVDTPLFYYRQHNSSLSRNEKKLYNARSKIFSRLREKIEGPYKLNILAVIPVRESFPKFKKVPFTQIGDQTLLERAINVAQQVDGITSVLVSTDSEAVIEHTDQLSAQKKIAPVQAVLRPSELSGDYIHLQQILHHAGKEHFAATNHYPDVVVFLNLHAPLRDAQSITKALNVLLVTESDTVVSVVEEREPVFMHSENGIKLVGAGRFDGLFHRREQVFKYNGNTIAVWWDILDQGAVWGNKIGYVEMTAEDSIQLKLPESLPQVLEVLNLKD